MRERIFFALLIISLAGCAVESSFKDQNVVKYINNANNALLRNDCKSLEEHTMSALLLHGGREEVGSFLDNKTAFNCFYSVIYEQIHEVTSPIEANRLHNKLSALSSIDGAVSNRAKVLLFELEKIVEEGNKSGTIKFLLSDSISNFPVLSDLEHQSIMITRSIEALNNNHPSRPIRRIIAYIEEIGPDSPEGLEIYSKLVSLDFTDIEYSLLEKVYPNFRSGVTEKVVDTPVLWPDAFSRRSFQLGITLEKFKSMMHPDSEKYPNAYVICSNEPKANNRRYYLSLFLTENMKKAGVIQCGYFYRDDVSGIELPAQMYMGDLVVNTEFYFLSSDSNAYRLFYIVSYTPTSNYDSLLMMFRSVYGRPNNSSREVVSNYVGATFYNDINIWTNKVSKIKLTRYTDTLKTMQVRYTLDPLWDVYGERLMQISRENANRL